MYFGCVWCTASLIGLSPILAFAILRVNALSPLQASLAGCSPALVYRVSWDSPTPCILFVFVLAFWSGVQPLVGYSVGVCFSHAVSLYWAVLSVYVLVSFNFC